jgi:TonB family protein
MRFYSIHLQSIASLAKSPKLKRTKLLSAKTRTFARAGRRIAHNTAMQSLWPSAKTSRKVLAALVSLAGLSGVLVWSLVSFPSRAIPPRPPLSQLERTLRRAPAHISEFSPVSEPLALPKCGEVRPPEALLTPDPLLDAQDDDLHVRVSFIIGSDGRVHSALILDSGGPEKDRIVLRAVRLWRYRPALCNGVPTDFEALVRFSIH